MTVDNNDVVYVLSGCGRKHTWNYVLTIFSIDGTVQQSPLKFIENKDARSLCMAVTQDERIVVAFVEGDQSNITVCGCHKDGELFLKELKEKGKPTVIVGDIKSLTVSVNTIAIILFREELFRKSHKLLTYNMEGDQKKALRFDPNLKGIIRVYDEVIYTPAVNAITGYYFNVTNANLVIEIISSETAKHKLSLVLMKTEYDPVFIDSIRLVHHVNGQVALVTKERTLHLKKDFALEESCMSNENRRRKSIVKKNFHSYFSLEKLPENIIRMKKNFTAKKAQKTADNSESKGESKSAGSEGSSENPNIEEPKQRPVSNIIAQFEKNE
ncbi:uncharacterized protein LOC124438931 [Xenia sp. Carnegie-2017]|uniref:uncharacterized protein LOC124438931 n=1 Tax=Xenia sp. Carnegie-2017 TaxID=2897299 RepID=UPI001F04FD08|nr:uncharacterized protein LOC124438931 [Xenia sp. Carnegie-2017]